MTNEEPNLKCSHCPYTLSSPKDNDMINHLSNEEYFLDSYEKEALTKIHEDINEEGGSDQILEQTQITFKERPKTTSFMESVRPDNSGMSVTQIKTKSKVGRCKEELENNPTPSQPRR